ncbi:MAG: thioesterase [Candidatus Dadabacteria bacterium]|nr:thioesterase [Candidatus Dadabacteria bacterium]NIV42941.1 thioesterase [Candidatus Dadabacteria bacterium]NIX16000.1 thioesterase [Candidatus Dadabacteria bacterium]
MARINIELPNDFIYSTEIKLRISDINYGGHLAHDSILSLTHEARVRFLQSLGYSEANIDGPGIILSDAALVYKSEAFYGQSLKIDIVVNEFSKFGCDFVYKLSDSKTLKEVARVKTGIVFYDYNKREICRVPQKFKSEFNS